METSREGAHEGSRQYDDMNRRVVLTRPTDRAVRFVAVAALSATVASWLGGWFWAFELLTHFRVQFIAGAMALAVVAILRRNERSVLIAILVAAAHLMPLWAYVIPGAIDVQAGPASTRLMSFNVNLKNRDFHAAISLVEDENPDIVGFVEVNDAWIGELSVLHDAYPYSILRPEEGAYGMALFSRMPLRELAASPYAEGGIQAAILAEVVVQEARVSLILAHLAAPTSPRKADLRNRQLGALTGMLTPDADREQIFIGDLNITPWSPHYTQLERDAGLKNAALARGYWPTWPTGINPLKIPIDHCLLSDGIRVQQFRTGSNIGSDHLPIIVDVEIVDATSRAATGIEPYGRL